jgi:26S proteasome regulatory subunit N12
LQQIIHLTTLAISVDITEKQPTMADRQLASLRDQLRSPTVPYQDAVSLLSKSKILLLQSQALTPSPNSPSQLLPLAREILELGALHAIRSRDAPAFIRYVDQLEPFYSLAPGHPAAVSGSAVAERNKITGLYLLLLLSQSRYSEFHSELEALATREGGGSAVDVEGDRYLGYPIRLERWLMEGSYDRVWKAMKKGEVPCEEYGVFSEVCVTLPPLPYHLYPPASHCFPKEQS